MNILRENDINRKFQTKLRSVLRIKKSYKKMKLGAKIIKYENEKDINFFKNYDIKCKSTITLFFKSQKQKNAKEVNTMPVFLY